MLLTLFSYFCIDVDANHCKMVALLPFVYTTQVVMNQSCTLGSAPIFSLNIKKYFVLLYKDFILVTYFYKNIFSIIFTK